MTGTFPWLKGHGTRNDFVLLPDPDGTLHGTLDDATVRLLCDRRAGIGADGVMRVIRTASARALGLLVAAAEGTASAEGTGSGEGTGSAEGTASPGPPAEWFMDYRNADGSVAEMCGNGVRVLARYLWDEGLSADDPLPIATRGGVRLVHRGTHRTGDGSSTVEMGVPQTARVRAQPLVTAGTRTWPAVAVFVPNPHAVVYVDSLDDPGDLRTAPRIIPPAVFPDGANVEFALRPRDRHLALRVYERGVGETPSCGTGVVAAAWTSMRRDDAPPGTPYTVDVPGGRLVVEQRADGVLLLTGPAVLGPRGELDLAWLR